AATAATSAAASSSAAAATVPAAAAATTATAAAATVGGALEITIIAARLLVLIDRLDVSELDVGGDLREFDSSLVVRAEALHGDDVPDLDDLIDPLDVARSELADMDEPFLSREHFDEAAEVLDRDDAAVVDPIGLDLLRERLDPLLSGLGALGVRRPEIGRAHVLDLDRRVRLLL